jgi:UDP-4-amino-4,6-dideoxy-N-acetyl-beta-L-altrosamine transaminase
VSTGPTLSFLPYGRQAIDNDDIAAVASVLRGPMLTTGPKIAEFEAALAAKLQASYAVSCSSGTAALHLAIAALGIDSGDKVIVPSITFVATANAARYMGAEIVFADVDPDNGLMRPDDLEEALRRAGQGVKAVLPVHLGGQAEDMAAIRAITTRAGAMVIEDACHALGGAHLENSREAMIGSCRYSDMAVFSFHPVKAIAAGEGGAITTRDPALARKLVTLRSHGLEYGVGELQNSDLALDPRGQRNPWYYELQHLGYNYRLTDIQCALALSQLAKLDRFIAARAALVARYEEKLKVLTGVMTPVRRTSASKPAWHLMAVLCDFAAIGRDRASVMNTLLAHGVGTQVHYIPVHRQPYYQRRYGKMDLPGADAYYARCLSLPLFFGMDASCVDRVVRTISEITR